MGGTVSVEQQAHNEIISKDVNITDAKRLEAVKTLDSLLKASAQSRVNTGKRSCDALLALLTTLLPPSSQEVDIIDEQNVTPIKNIIDLFCIFLTYKSFYSELRKCKLQPLIRLLTCNNVSIVSQSLDMILSMLTTKIVLKGSSMCTAKPEFQGERTDLCNFEYYLKEALFPVRLFETLSSLLVSYSSRVEESEINRDIVKKILESLHTPLLQRCASSSFNVISRIVDLFKVNNNFTLLLDLSISKHIPIRRHASKLVSALLLHSKEDGCKLLRQEIIQSGKLLWYVYLCINKMEYSQLEELKDHAEYIDEHSFIEYRQIVSILSSYDPINRILINILPFSIRVMAIQKTIVDPPKVASHVVSAIGKVDVQNYVWKQFLDNVQPYFDWANAFDRIDHDSRVPLLIWNNNTREELIVALKKETDAFKQQLEISSTSKWDYEGFEVAYPSLLLHLKINNYYVHLILPYLEAVFPENPHQASLENIEYLDNFPVPATWNVDDNQKKLQYFNLNETDVRALLAKCFQHIVIEDYVGWKLASLRVMSALYENYTFLQDNDMMPYLIFLAQPKTPTGAIVDIDALRGNDDTLSKNKSDDTSLAFTLALDQHLFSLQNNPLWRDHVFRHFHGLFTRNTINVNRFVEHGGVNLLMYYINEAHRELSNTIKTAIYATKEQPVITQEIVDSYVDTNSQKKQLHTDVVQPKRDDLLVGVALPHDKTKIAKRCLVLLELIVASVTRLRKVIFKESLLITLVQVLLTGNPILYNLALKTLMNLIDANTHVITRLYATNVFIFILYALAKNQSMSDEMYQFICKYHKLQHDKKGSSILEPYLPKPLVTLSMEPRPELTVQSVFNSTVNTPLIIWNDATKNILTTYINQMTMSSVKLLQKYPHSTCAVLPTSNIVYDVLERELYIANVFVRVFREQKDAVIDKPEEFFDAIIAEMHAPYYYNSMKPSIVKHIGELTPVEVPSVTKDASISLESHLIYVMDAQCIMADRLPKQEKLASYTPLYQVLLVLSSCKAPLNADNELYTVALNLLRTVTALTEHKNACEVVDRNGIELLVELIVRTSANVLTKITNKKNVALLTQLFVILQTIIVSSVTVPGEGRENVISKLVELFHKQEALASSFFGLLTKLFKTDFVVEYPELTQAILRTLYILFESTRESHVYFLKYGMVLDLTRLMLSENILAITPSGTPSTSPVASPSTSPTNESAQAVNIVTTTPSFVFEYISIDETTTIRHLTVKLLAMMYFGQSLDDIVLNIEKPDLVYCNAYHSHDIVYTNNTLVGQNHILEQDFDGQELPEADAHTYIHLALTCMFSSGLCSKLVDAAEFLKIIDSEMENCYIIWNSKLRSDVEQFITRSIQSRTGTTSDVWAWGETAAKRVGVVGKKEDKIKPAFTLQPLQTEVVVQGVYVRLFASTEDQLPSNCTTHGFLYSLAETLYRVITNVNEKDDWKVYGSQIGILQISTSDNKVDTYTTKIENEGVTHNIEYARAIADDILPIASTNTSQRKSIAYLAGCIAKLGLAKPKLIEETLEEKNNALSKVLNYLVNNKNILQEQAVLHALHVFISVPQISQYKALDARYSAIYQKTHAIQRKSVLGAELIAEHAVHHLHHILRRESLGKTPEHIKLEFKDDITILTCGRSNENRNVLLALDILIKIIVVQSVTEKASIMQLLWENGIVLTLLNIISSIDAKANMDNLLTTLKIKDTLNETKIMNTLKNETSYNMVIRLVAMKLLGLLIMHPFAGQFYLEASTTLLSTNFTASLKSLYMEPLPFLSSLLKNVRDPGFFWNNGCLQDMYKFGKSQLSQIVAHHDTIVKAHALEVYNAAQPDTTPATAYSTNMPLVIVPNSNYSKFAITPQEWRAHYEQKELHAELCINNIYIYSLLRQLDYTIADPVTFLKAVFKTSKELMGNILWMKNDYDASETDVRNELNIKVVAMTKQLCACFSTIIYFMMSNSVDLQKLFVGEDFLTVTAQFCTLEGGLEDITIAFDLEKNDFFGKGSNTGEGVNTEAIAYLTKLWTFADNQLVLHALTIIQIVTETQTTPEFLKDRMARFILPLLFIYNDYYANVMGVEDKFVNTNIVRLTLNIVDNMIIQYQRKTNDQLLHMGLSLYLLNLLLQYDVLEDDICRLVCVVLRRFANCRLENFLQIIEHTSYDFGKVLLVTEPISMITDDDVLSVNDVKLNYKALLPTGTSSLNYQDTPRCKVISNDKLREVLSCIDKCVDMFEKLQSTIEKLTSSIQNWTYGSGRSWVGTYLAEDITPVQKEAATEAYLNEYSNALRCFESSESQQDPRSNVDSQQPTSSLKDNGHHAEVEPVHSNPSSPKQMPTTTEEDNTIVQQEQVLVIDKEE